MVAPVCGLYGVLTTDSGRTLIGGSESRPGPAGRRASGELDDSGLHLFEALADLRSVAGDEELLESLRRAQIADWVTSLPQGLDPGVGEAGSRLSGGQRPRLVRARALLADRPVLVLDEPTAHLDAATAEQLMKDVLDAAGDRTVLLITHRTEGLDRMDQTVRLD